MTPVITLDPWRKVFIREAEQKPAHPKQAYSHLSPLAPHVVKHPPFTCSRVTLHAAETQTNTPKWCNLGITSQS